MKELTTEGKKQRRRDYENDHKSSRKCICDVTRHSTHIQNYFYYD